MKIERQLQGTLNTVFTELIKERKLESKFSPYAIAEEGRADITLKDAKGKAIFFIELKDPTAKDGKTVFNADIILREIERAEKMDVKYFGVCNFTALTLIDKAKISEKVAFSDGFFTISELNRLRTNFKPDSADILKKLRNIANFYLDKALEIVEKKTFTANPIDEIFIFKIRKLIEAYAFDITDKVFDKYQQDKAFEKKLTEYALKQQWNKPENYEEIENLTYIALLMLISKLIFYKTYQDAIYDKELSKLHIDENITTARKLETTLWDYFTEFQEVTGDFELLIGEKTDVIYQVPFVGDAVIDLVREVVKENNTYNFATTPYDIIGRIFEELIREDERHKLGQYFTPPVVIDLINAFCIRKATDKVLDPSCGSGTFLVRAYERKRNLGMKLHQKLLLDIYGSDISNYAVYLAMLNLSIRNMRNPSYPRILHRDFFSLRTNKKEKFLINKNEVEQRILPQFDAIVGNPPYTRQEDINAFNDKAKQNIFAQIYQAWGIQPSQRTSIYGHFFYYASAFLKEGGYLGFVVSNSWLDTDFGVDMQGFFLENFEVIAVIESSVERFFPSAEVNTNILILRRQSNATKRNNNTVKFIYLHEKLATITAHYKSADALTEFLENAKLNTENQSFKINIVKQSDLKNQNKWSIFLKAPKVYWQILEKGKDKFVKLKEVADVKRGITTGCNEFFILKDKTNDLKDKEISAIVNNLDSLKSISEIKKRKLSIVQNGFNELWLIENEFLKPILTSPKDSDTYLLEENKIKTKVLLTNIDVKSLKKYSYLNSYIDYGQRKKTKGGYTINELPTCAARNLWYNLGNLSSTKLSFNRLMNDFSRVYYGDFVLSDIFYNIFINKNEKNLFFYFNSTISWLLQQMIIRTNFGGGAGEIKVYEFADFPIVLANLEKLNIDLGNTKGYKEELGVLDFPNLQDLENLRLKNINPQRLKLDDAILQALGFTNKTEREAVLLDLYKGVIDLISRRLEKSKSLKTVSNNRNKIESTVYVDNLKKLIVENNLKPKATLTFAKKLQTLISDITADNKLQQKIVASYWKETFDESYNLDKISKKEQHKLF